MVETLRRVVDSSRFHNFITLVILLAAVLVGIETYPSAVARYGSVLHALDKVVLGIFVLEIVLKMGAEGRRPWRYFRDPWNVFDFAIVAFAFMPVGSQYVTVLRLARLLRVLRLVHALPRLQILVGALLKSVPSMGYVSLLLLNDDLEALEKQVLALQGAIRAVALRAHARRELETAGSLPN